MGLAQQMLPKTYHGPGLKLLQHPPLHSVSSCFADSCSCGEPFADSQALQGLLLAYGDEMAVDLKRFGRKPGQGDLKLGGFHFLDGKCRAHHALPVCTYKLMRINAREPLPLLKQQHPPPEENRREERNHFTWLPIPLINKELGPGE